ncbi:gamma-aminobutyric acid type B receptor subunit 2-like [Acanthaster planci]|uniref:Gamma-aminobutyric acid type B receptor subunit 2 n=1 Tax=Acanthaster planci TaxID=133434 RepID=A0A8B7YBK2_ACAPL|nr:gamma-aminobutyric acid type B receptor subunit 2-like [Acanthaster planci]
MSRVRIPTAFCLLLTIAFFFDELLEFRGVALAVQRDVAGSRPVYIGGFFPIGTHPFFASLPSTVQTAIDHVNNLTGILDGYELRMRWNWTQGSPANALWILNDFIQRGPPVTMVWGPLFSTVAVVMNEVLPRYDIVQVITASSSTLKDRSRYPLTVQLANDEDLLNPARVAFIKHIGWRKVALVFEDNVYFRQNTANLTMMLEESNITVLTTEAVRDAGHPEEQIQSLKRHDARIIIASFYPEPAAKFFCKIHEAHLFDAKYVWILPGWYPAGWWQDVPGVSCSNDEMASVLDLHLGFSASDTVSDVSLIDFNGVKPYSEQLDFLQRLHAMEDNGRDTYSYDCLFAIALALNASIADLEQLTPPKGLDEFSYGDTDMAAILLRKTLKTNFIGLTGHVVISKEGYRNSTVQVDQFQDGTLVWVGTHSSDGEYVEITNRSLQWKGSFIPVDGKTELPQAVHLSSSYEIVIFSVTSLGALLSLVFLALNIALRNQRAIKISSPSINSLIALGCLLLYSSVFVSGLNRADFSDTAFTILCFVDVWLICVGISFSFGSLLVKTYRIFAIFERAVARFKKIDLPDKKLISVVMLLVLVDSVTVIFWVTLGQPMVKTINLEPRLSDTISPEKEIYILPVLRQCSSVHEVYFTAAIYGFKGILLVLGLFLSWEIRNVSIKGLNDSKYIALSIYVVTITIVLTVPTLQVFVYNADMHFCIFSTAIILANTAVLCLVFVPKLALCYTSRGNQLSTSIMESTTAASVASAKQQSLSSKERNRLINLRRKLCEKEETLIVLLAEYRAVIQGD